MIEPIKHFIFPSFFNKITKANKFQFFLLPEELCENTFRVYNDMSRF